MTTLSTELPPDARAWVEVNLGAIAANVRTIRRGLAPGTAFMAVVKADAYGHGLLPVAQTALASGADWLGVASVAEGIALRQAGCGTATPIFLLCAPPPDSALALLAHDLTPPLGDPALLNALVRAGEELGVPVHAHLEIETGMGRSGVLPERAVALWQAARRAGIVVEGLTTHFADADNADETYSREQEARFARAHRDLLAAGARFQYVHLCNSAALQQGYGPAASLVRPGLLLYGIAPVVAEGTNLPPFRLEPALTVKARIAMVRDLPRGHAVSYGATHRLTRPSRLATVLIGYGDGYPRRLSGRGSVQIAGRMAPILGRVCMDQTVVDVTDLPDVQPGDVALCVGGQDAPETEPNLRVKTLARLLDTTHHEITTCLTARLPRVYIPAPPSLQLDGLPTS